MRKCRSQPAEKSLFSVWGSVLCNSDAPLRLCVELIVAAIVSAVGNARRPKPSPALRATSRSRMCVSEMSSLDTSTPGPLESAFGAMLDVHGMAVPEPVQACDSWYRHGRIRQVNESPPYILVAGMLRQNCRHI